MEYVCQLCGRPILDDADLYLNAIPGVGMTILHISCRERRIPTPATVRADCGHLVERDWLMNASTGTSCPDCYDHMS